MAFIADVPRRASKILKNPNNSMCEDENFAYLQPPKARPAVYARPYRKPTLKIESETTYGSSYVKFDRASRPKFHYGIDEKTVADKTGKFDFDTVYKLSYQASTGKLRRAFVPKSCLTINGSHDMTTTFKLSYLDPGYVKTMSYKPHRGKIRHPIPVDYNTVTKESYRDFGTPTVKRPRKRGFWQTKYKTDYQTTNRLSYQYVEPLSKRVRVCYRPIINAQMEKDTVYSTSYQVPGRCVPKETIVCE